MIKYKLNKKSLIIKLEKLFSIYQLNIKSFVKIKVKKACRYPPQQNHTF